jgi:hypothetical protein
MIEKAYAKLLGSYNMISEYTWPKGMSQITPGQFMRDLTHAPTICHDLCHIGDNPDFKTDQHLFSDHQKVLGVWRPTYKTFNKRYELCCKRDEEGYEALMEEGLKFGYHALVKAY